jgi:16S rRNA (uracil1498-N3)-methyltransferase
MSQRYFVETRISGARATLVDAEAHHLAHVMRAKAGDQVILFDGAGGEYAAVVERVARSTIELAVLAHRAIDRELAAPVVVGASLPKGDRQRWLIEKLVELGVTDFVPLATARGVAQPVGNVVDRLRRAVVEASKQCGRNRLMQIQPPQKWRAFVCDAPAAAGRLIAHPGADRTLADVVRGAPSAAAAGMFLAVGPEGGFTDDEARLALSAGWTGVDLGSRILRVETAAATLAGAAAIMLGESAPSSNDA